MSEKHGHEQPGKHELYEIRLEGHLDEHWSEWFDDLTISYDEDDNTILSGQLADQSALHGVLKKAHGLSLSLISVSQVEPSAQAQPEIREGGEK